MHALRLERILGFLLFTFILSWGVSTLVDSVSVASLPIGMFFPTFTALIMEIFFLKYSPMYHKTIKELAILVPYGFICFTV